MNGKLITKKSISVNLILFILLIIFFTKLCPVIPFDGDDWYFTGSMRLPIPMWKAFNPIKVLPEVLEPLGGLVAAYLIYPLTNDYIGAIALVQAIVISAFVVLLFFEFYQLICLRFNLDTNKSLMFEIIFAFSFFFFFKKYDSISEYGFWANDLNCYFNYIIPGILNAIIILVIARYENFIDKFDEWSYIKQGAFAVSVYFAIFSSIQLSITLSAYCSYEILKILVKEFKNRKENKIKKIFSKCKVYIIILVCWLISLIFEMNGFRSEMIGKDNWLNMKNIMDVIHNFYLLYKQTNIIYIVMFTFCIFVIFFSLIKNHSRDQNVENKLFEFITKNIYLIIITFLFLFVIYLKAGATYASTTSGTWALLFYIILFANVSLIWTFKLIPKFERLIPFIMIMMFFLTFNMNYKFKQSVFDYDIAKDIGNTIINQIIEADKSGKNYVEVQVPNYSNSSSNWPQPYNMAIWLQNGLYAHNITKNRMKIVFVKNDDLYNKFYVKDYKCNERYYDFENRTYLPKK